MKTKLLLIVLFCAGFVSCRNDFDPIFGVEGEKLAGVYSGDEKIREFEYDNHERLSIDKSQNFYYSYTYWSGKGRITKKMYIDQGVFSATASVATRALNREEWVDPQNTALYAELSYEFDSGNRLVRSEEVLGYSEYEYDANGRIAVRKSYHLDKLAGTHRYSYDERGNLIRKDHYSGGTVSSRTEYKYDEMKNPYYHLIPDRIPGENTNPNNVIHEKYTVYNYPNAGEESVVTDNVLSYRYNSLGYPAERSDGMRFVYRK